MENLEIIPFIGAGIYKLGTPFNQVKKSLNENIQIQETKKGKRIIDGAVSLKFVNDELSEFSILGGYKVFFEGKDVFSDGFEEELKKQYTSVYKFGFLIFDEIGLALSGYIEKEEQKTITVYRKDAWDQIIKLPG